MTKGIIAALWVITTLTACARENEPRTPNDPPEVFQPVNTGRELKVEDFPNVANSVFGAWEADYADDFGQGMVYFLSIYLNENNEIGMKRTCLGSGQKLEVATVVDAKVTGSKIKIADEAYVLEKGGLVANCELRVKAESLSYTRTGDKLEVTFPKGEIRSFTRTN